MPPPSGALQFTSGDGDGAGTAESSSAWRVLSTPLAQQQTYQQQRQTAFQALRPITTQLLALRNQPERLQPQLLALRQLLEGLSPAGVAGCWDYVAFPLMILLDSVVPARQGPQPGQGTGVGGRPSPAGSAGAGAGAAGADMVAPACRSDRVLEALLGALQALLERSPGPDHDPDQDQGRDPKHHTTAPFPGLQAAAAAAAPAADRQLAALHHLAPLLQLPREEASEETHMALQRCLAAALAPLAAAAADENPVAAAGRGAPGAASSGARGGGAGSSRRVLCGEEAVSLAGYLLHCCLEVSEREVLAGHRGSKPLCAAALTSLGLLVAALPDPDTLAFFLPGIVSGLSKHLYTAGAAASHSGPSAPPGAAATVQALACLRDAVTIVLSDDSTAAILGTTPFVNTSTTITATTTTTGASAGASPLLTSPPDIRRAEDALSALKALSLSTTSTSTTTGIIVPAPSPQPAAAEEPPPPQRRRLHVDRTLPWLEETSGRINSLLGRALPPLCAHPRPAVRAQLAATCAQLLDRCGRALAPSQPLLLRLLFTLAQDEWRQVAAPCLDWMARHAPQPAPPPTIAATARGTAVVGGRPGAGMGSAAAADGGGCGSGSSVSEGVGDVVVAIEGGGGGEGEGGGQTAEFKALENEFERFMQGLMSDSALLEPPALEVDEDETYGGSDEGAGGRDQGATAPPARGAAGTELALSLHPAPRPLDSGREGAAGTGGAASTSDARHTGPPPTPLPPRPKLTSPTTAAVVALSGLQHLIADAASAGFLLRAVRVGEAEAVVQARCLTTALMVAGPARAAEWLLLRPAALGDLLAGLFRCFAFDRNAAPLILHLRGEAGAYAPSVVAAAPASVSGPPGPAVAAAATAAAVATAMAGGAAAAAELPRMPLGLLHLASQRSYSAVAAVAKSLGRLARAADLEAATTAAVASAAAAAAPEAAGGRPGASALRRLVDELVASLRAAERGSRVDGRVHADDGGGDDGGSGRSRRSSDDLGGEADGGGDRRQAAAAARTAAGGRSWQCDAAAVVSVAAEVVIGASNAWVPPLGAPQAKEYGQPAAPPAPAFPAVDPTFEAVLLELLQELTRTAIIKLRTHNSGSALASGAPAPPTPLLYDDVVHPELAAPRQPLTVQELGENVLLLRVVMEAVGAAARALGPRFAAQGRLLRTVLMPLLELLGDPAPSVAAAADTALQSICAHCGYSGSLKALLGANADYVVDALCARLRDLQRHPRAPHLLAALLRRAGVAPQLLPLMAEPLQRALAVLRELAAGAAAEAAAAGEASRTAVAEINRLAAETRDRAEAEREEEAAAAAAAAAQAEGPAAGQVDPESRYEEVRRYFMERSADGEGGKDGAAAGGPGGGRPLLTLTAGQLEDSEVRFRRLHAAAVVAGAAADAATPLLLSSDLRAAVTASEVLHSALAALAASTPGVEAEAAVVEEYGGSEGRMRPVRPETPKVLPAVAAAWSPLMAALRDARTPVVERGLAAAAELVAVAGGTFLARRFQQEAWPVLQRLLTHGTAHTPGLLSLGTEAARSAPRRRLEPLSGGAGGDVIVSAGEDSAGALAPAAVTRVRVAALGCLAAVCRCKDAAVAVRSLTWGVAQAALPFLGSSHPAPLHEAAQTTLLAVAALDPDGVWLLLYDTMYNVPPSLAPPGTDARPIGTGQRAGPMPAQHKHHQPVAPAAGCFERNPSPPGPDFPPLRALLPPLPGGATGRYGSRSGSGGAAGSSQRWPVTVGLAADCGPRAQSLLAVVVADFEAPWHRTDVPLLDVVADA